MHYSAHLSQRSHHWLKDVQFLAGILVVAGGAAVVLKDLVAALGGLI